MIVCIDFYFNIELLLGIINDNVKMRSAYHCHWGCINKYFKSPPNVI